MTPALDLLKKHRAEHRVHSYEHDPKSASYGLEAAEKLGLDPQQVFKTLLASSEKGELLVAVVPVGGTLDLKALAHAAGVKKCEMADPAAAQRATGYLVGGISPLGQRNACAPSSMIRRRTLQPSMSVPDGEGSRWSWRPQCWPSIPRANLPALAEAEKLGLPCSPSTLYQVAEL